MNTFIRLAAKAENYLLDCELGARKYLAATKIQN